MALIKPIMQPNGLTLGYHMIAKIDIEPNQGCCILVHSYVDAKARQYMKDYAAGKIEGEPNFPYYNYRYISTPYLSDLSVCGAYEWIRKNIPEYADAEADIDAEDESYEISGDDLKTLIEGVL